MTFALELQNSKPLLGPTWAHANTGVLRWKHLIMNDFGKNHLNQTITTIDLRTLIFIDFLSYNFLFNLIQY